MDERRPDPPALRPSLEGQKLGRYRLGQRVGEGGMGEVYLATTRGLAGVGRQFAIKTMHPHLLDTADLVARFVDEARTTARIDHPHVCSVIDFGEDDGITYLVMEYLHGEPFSALLKRRQSEPLPLWLICRVVADAARGLHSAHELRDLGGHPLAIVHRDVSPQNLFVLYDGPCKVLDFGIAQVPDRDASPHERAVRGKPAYAAPEQVDEVAVDRRVDIWSLGVVLHEALTRRRLFWRNDPVASLAAVISAPIPDALEARPGAPASLRALLGACLQRDRNQRIATAAELVERLEESILELGERADHARVADWMRGEFGDAIVQKERLLLALKGAPTTQRDIAPLMDEWGYTSQVTLPDVEAAPGRLSLDAGPTRIFPSAAPVPPPPRSRLPLLIWGGVGIAVGIAFTVLAYSVFG